MAFEFAPAHDRYLPFIRTVVSSYPERYREDLTQEGLWGLYLGCCAYDVTRGTPFDAYIKVCIRNRICSAARGFASDYHLVPLDEVDVQIPSSESPLEERYAESDAVKAAFQALQPRLSDLERRVLHLYLSGLSSSRISEVLEIPPKSADNAMTRIKKKIRDYLPE